MLSSNALDIQKQYDDGKRDFQKLQLRRMDLRSLNLKDANLRGTDLSYTNLRNSNLTGADLRDVYLNEADLTGANLSQANLSQASLIKTYLIKANLTEANLKKAYLTGAYLTKANLRGALLQGSYFNNAQLSGATLTDAYYDKTTCFDPTIDPAKLGLKDSDKILPFLDSVYLTSKTSQSDVEFDIDVSSVSIEALVKMFNHLTETSNHYLGSMMTIRYWKSAGSEVEWYQEFAINSSAKVTYMGSQQTPLTPLQLEAYREWIIAFVKSCSLIIQNYTTLLKPEFLAFPIGPSTTGKKTLIFLQ